MRGQGGPAGGEVLFFAIAFAVEIISAFATFFFKKTNDDKCCWRNYYDRA